MKRPKVWWFLVLALLSLPYVLLFIAGSLWLYEYRMLLGWFAVSLVVSLIGWQIMKGLREDRILPRVEPELKWPPVGQQAWAKVEAVAVRSEGLDLPLNRPDALWQVVQEVLHTVAAHYHPNVEEAWLEIPVPYVMRIVELVAKDLREITSGYVPGAHILTVNDWRRLWRLASWANRSYVWYRIISFVMNSPAAIVRELRDFYMTKLTDSSAVELKRWAVGFCVRRAGYYAIQMYGGYLVLDDVKFSPFVTRRSKTDDRKDSDRQRHLAEEPLRILVVGQVKAGKSSLINAMFGEHRAATDVVPRTQFVEPYLLEREGIQRAIILDTAGYDDTSGPADGFDQLRKHLLSCDLALMVCSAQSAARNADRRLLDAMRTFYQREPERRMPALVVVLTKVDRLRPLAEWNPPYNLDTPCTEKARQILDAMHAVATDLLVEPDQIIPVCLEPDRLYNVDDALVPTVLRKLPEAQRVKYLRCLREFRKQEYWEGLGRQAIQAGRLLLNWMKQR